MPIAIALPLDSRPMYVAFFFTNKTVSNSINQGHRWTSNLDSTVRSPSQSPCSTILPVFHHMVASVSDARRHSQSFYSSRSQQPLFRLNFRHTPTTRRQGPRNKEEDELDPRVIRLVLLSHYNRRLFFRSPVPLTYREPLLRLLYPETRCSLCSRTMGLGLSD